METNVEVSFANSNTRYAQHVFPEINQQSNATLIAWKFEKLNAQILLYSKTNVASVSVLKNELKGRQWPHHPQKQY